TELGSPSGQGHALRWQQITKGDDIASASTITIPNEGSLFVVTGSATISSLGDSFPGRSVTLIFEDGITLVNSSSLLLPGSSNITTVYGQALTFICNAPGVWLCLPSSRGSLLNVRTYSTQGTYTYSPTRGTSQIIVEGVGGGG